ncbi:4-alpha-glucanotransferase [Tuwongella immobilis]|uniref:4-alpha-glucanotransferase n=1 Tax=Tuwongella immobilis TaxID=692036 RepID=A0A6C2YNM6_9BACT|nr:4-alpha-glucanotransferase [Tuwongella immobilis]VIP02891.1 4-alpha-glucanotransferase : 4-alpha-glucanotransferase OS=Anaerolinea thermophila (strain DSM 14523 / JCM 11388 / NBRC 100420 / UNI-1) GN=malQ PE=3 SV=1: Glyco_hydro_77 [Tuwongella immobilis]VTS02761.1 4-alpha-glucanotransferase : 4-alpha-glucanotransferase OS=Anaerolinea thermophila (strain DSM 14523 / JCM 11388 / NBRC 100420 / UNI-1) GN=malQ PE=3 SV=1: Glyco_hydro_77 [Tuwongella immobilis]
MPGTIPRRSAGLLLHPTSLPGPYGIGDLGPAARVWIDTLARAKQTWWQILPLGPTGYGDSPYQCYSAFAGNPYLISPEQLAEDGLLATPPPLDSDAPVDRVDYDRAIPYKVNILREAWANFQGGRSAHLKSDFESFRHQHRAWLDDYALFRALKDARSGAPWYDWPTPLREFQPAAIDEARREFADGIGFHAFSQFLFFRQLRQLREYGRERGVKLIGDAPIFVSGDSADAWANPQLFLLDENRRPTVVAGVPPDYFSPTGQLWGNPVYRWDAMERDGYRWWIDRMRMTLESVDLVRLDHFRGFAAAWHVPAGDATAEYGSWVPGPGAALFEKMRDGLGWLPIIAEDLGVISPDVDALRTQFDLPGMRILHFAFWGDPNDRFLPHNYERNTVVYTGTHDNDTTMGWYHTLQAHERAFLQRYLGGDRPESVVWDLIRLAWSSVADLAIVPVQDVLELDTRGRMNLPGRLGGNWLWRMEGRALHDPAFERLGDLTDLYSRTAKRSSLGDR